MATFNNAKHAVVWASSSPALVVSLKNPTKAGIEPDSLI